MNTDTNEWNPGSKHVMIDRNVIWNGGTAVWVNQIQPYLKNVQVFVCPSSPVVGWNNGQGITNTRDYCSYILNYSMCANGKALAAINDPAEKVIVYDKGATNQVAQSVGAMTNVSGQDANGNGGQGGFPRNWDDWNITGAGNGWNLGTEPHNEGRNMAFIDGHVKWLGTRQAWGERRRLSYNLP